MATYEVTYSKEPEYNPGRTTGDPVIRTELSVEWTGRPSDDELRRFEQTYPAHLFSAFHYVEGVGKVYETPA